MGLIKTRKCLKCRRDFQSQGPQNRICDACTKKQPKTKGAQSNDKHRRAYSKYGMY